MHCDRAGKGPACAAPDVEKMSWPVARLLLEHLTLEMLAYGRQKPAYSHFVARIFRKILAEHLTHFIRKLL